MKILHTEASLGLGGQELRILEEAKGMIGRGHQVILALAPGSNLGHKARENGLTVCDVPFEQKRSAAKALFKLCRIIRQHEINIVNTHSSWDAWVGGLAARLSGCSVIRTRHLSTPTHSGWNSRLLFHTLADTVVTTCEETARTIRLQALLKPERCLSIPTGINPVHMQVNQGDIESFRAHYGLSSHAIVIGTVCILRFWKGVTQLIDAAKLLERYSNLKWLIVGDGPSRYVFEQQCRNLGIQDRVIFTGYLSNPSLAIGAMDIFSLLSTAHEGVSQAALQAAYLRRPLVTTRTGGLSEVCLDGETGLLVPTHSPEQVAVALTTLIEDSEMRKRMGQNGHQLVLKRFTLEHMLNDMEGVYKRLSPLGRIGND